MTYTEAVREISRRELEAQRLPHGPARSHALSALRTERTGLDKQEALDRAQWLNREPATPHERVLQAIFGDKND